jgi:indole-3-glycerol phosphate synthase
VLVEVHDEEELQGALDVEAEVIGINNRDLGDFTVDIERTYELLSDVPPARPWSRSRASPRASSSTSSTASAWTPCWSARP